MQRAGAGAARGAAPEGSPFKRGGSPFGAVRVIRVRVSQTLTLTPTLTPTPTLTLTPTPTPTLPGSAWWAPPLRSGGLYRAVQATGAATLAEACQHAAVLDALLRATVGLDQVDA